MTTATPQHRSILTDQTRPDYASAICCWCRRDIFVALDLWGYNRWRHLDTTYVRCDQKARSTAA
jgi:hypothetical protein